jgi:hypothetical protein
VLPSWGLKKGGRGWGRVWALQVLNPAVAVTVPILFVHLNRPRLKKFFANFVRP